MQFLYFDLLLFRYLIDRYQLTKCNFFYCFLSCFFFCFFVSFSDLFCHSKTANSWCLCGATVGTCKSFKKSKWYRLLYNRNISSEVSACFPFRKLKRKIHQITYSSCKIVYLQLLAFPSKNQSLKCVRFFFVFVFILLISNFILICFVFVLFIYSICGIQCWYLFNNPKKKLFCCCILQVWNLTCLGCTTVSTSWHCRQIDYIDAQSFYLRCIFNI